MSKKLTAKIILVALLVITAIVVACFLIFKNLYSVSQVSSIPKSSGVEYRNTTYGFSVALPESWKGYSVSIDKWTGNDIGDQLGEKTFTDGPLISIHNPKWTGVNTYQDIPIMIFTIDQWNLLQQEKFHIGAAPMGPSELGRNSKFVFALPARYNYAFPPGYEEVDQIIQSKPLTTF